MAPSRRSRQRRRVECAALEYADPDLAKLAEAVEVALLDWRDAVVSADGG